MRKEDRGNLLGGWVPKQRDEDKPKRQKPEPAPSVLQAFGGAAGVSLLASFAQNAISSADGSTPMTRATAGANVAVGVELPSAKCMSGGWIFDVTIRVDGGDTTATYWQVEVYVNAAATGIIKRLTGTTMSDQSTVSRFSVQPGDVITCVDSRSGAVNGQEGFADVWGRLEGMPGAAGV